MDSQQFDRELELKRSERVVRSAFFERFAGPSNPNGALVVAAIGEYCGANEQNPEEIKPELVAFWNWFLNMLGLRREVRGYLQRGEDYARFTAEAVALQSVMNETEIDREIAEMTRTPGEEEDGEGL